MATRQRPRATRLLVVSLVAASLAVITLDYREGASGPLAGVGRDALSLMEPMQRAVTTVTRPVGNFFSGLAHLPSLQEEKDQLERQVRDLQSQLDTTGFDQQQYEDLLALMNLKRSLAPDSIPAVVVASGPSNFEWTVTIAKGSDDGVARGMPVVTGTTGALAVGRVVSVAAHASTVELLIDRNSSVQGVLQGSREAGLVTGQGDGDLKMALVAQGTDVQGNESVFTQGYCVNGVASIFPAGILIGQVSRTVPQANAIQETISVRPAVDFSTLQFVLVLRTGGTC